METKLQWGMDTRPNPMRVMLLQLFFAELKVLIRTNPELAIEMLDKHLERLNAIEGTP